VWKCGSQEGGQCNKPYVTWSTALQPIQPWTFRQDWLGRQQKWDGMEAAAGGGGRERVVVATYVVLVESDD